MIARRGFGLLRLSALRPRRPMKPVNPERLARRRARQFGPHGYRAWLLAQGCVPCGRPASEMAHVISRATGGTWRDCVPMCRSCHRIQHRQGWQRLADATGWEYAGLLAKAHELAARWCGSYPGLLAEFERCQP